MDPKNSYAKVVQGDQQIKCENENVSAASKGARNGDESVSTRSWEVKSYERTQEEEEMKDKNQTPDVVDTCRVAPAIVTQVSIDEIIRMPTGRFDRYYNMTHKNRGIAYIFNHEIFDEKNMTTRTGTKKDSADLEQQLLNLGFAVEVFLDETFSFINDKLKEVAAIDHSDNDCLLICVMTHGETNALYARDTFYKPELLWSYFSGDNCPTLLGKPKIVILQACRGNQLDHGSKMYATFDQVDCVIEPEETYVIPNQADIFIGYSTVPDYFSWRNPDRGSWYIQSLVEALKLHGKDEDFLTLMTLVHQMVAFDWQSNTPQSPVRDKKKQMPCFVSMFTRLLKFEDKHTEES